MAAKNLTPEDCFVLLHNIRHVHAGGDDTRHAVPDKAIEVFLADCAKRMGAAYFQTPRETIKDWIGLLNVIQQNNSVDWRQLIGTIQTEKMLQNETKKESKKDDDDLASFTL